MQLGTKMNWLHFEGKRGKVRVTVTLHGQIPVSTLGGIFSPISGMHGCILTKFIHIGHRRPSTGLVAVQRHRQSQLLGGKFLINRSAWHYDIFKVMGSEVKVTDDIFAKMHFSGGGMLITSDLICFIAYLSTRCVEKQVRLWAGWVYRPQPKRKRTEMTINPLWARYMHQQSTTGSQFSPILCRPQMPATNASIVVSPPVSSLSNAIDRAKLGGKFLIAQNK